MTDNEKRRKRVEQATAWKRRNPEKVRASAAKYREKNKEKIAAYRKQTQADFNAKLKARRLADPAAWNAARRAFRKANADVMRERERAYRLRLPAKGQLCAAKKRAAAAGVAYDLDRKWFDERFKAGVCEVSGLPFILEKRSPFLPSIDRKNPKGPYTKENCRLVLWWLNRALSDDGDDLALTIFRAIFVKRGEILSNQDRIAA